MKMILDTIQHMIDIVNHLVRHNAERTHLIGAGVLSETAEFATGYSTIAATQANSSMPRLACRNVGITLSLM